MAEGSITNPNIHYALYTGTTNANGYLFTGIPTTTKIISAMGQDYPAVPITYHGEWLFFVFYPQNGTIIPDANAEKKVMYTYVTY